MAKTKRKFGFSNGDKVMEKVTGYEGVITGTCFYLTGCNQYLVVGKQIDKSKEPLSMWYDEGRLELVSDSEVKASEVQGEENGCDILPNVGRKGF